MALSEDIFEKLIKQVYSGEISVFDLPEYLYQFTLVELDKMFFEGYGAILTSDVAALFKAVDFRENLGRFSGAKTWQNVNTLTDAVFLQDGTKRPFAEFREIARKIDNQYNANWLRTEQDSTFIQSQNARKWIKFEDEKEFLPILEYVTVGDERVRPSHAALDGLKRPVNDPIWGSIMPQNDWGCRCIVIQHEADIKPSSDKVLKDKTELVTQDFKKNATFQYNPGKTGYIYKETGKGKHDYFKVPKEFKADLKNNFGLPSVEDTTGIEL